MATLSLVARLFGRGQVGLRGDDFATANRPLVACQSVIELSQKVARLDDIILFQAPIRLHSLRCLYPEQSFGWHNFCRFDLGADEQQDTFALAWHLLLVDDS